MRVTSDFRLRMALMLAAVLLSTLPGWAQTNPSRPVQLIVGYPPGGATLPPGEDPGEAGRASK